MASRMWNRRQALEKEVKDLYIKITFGASGAPTLASGASYGAASIVRNSAGDYTLTLSDRYNALKFADGKFLDDGAQDIRVQIKADRVATATKDLDFFTLTGASATDPASGQALLLKLELKNTSAV